VFVRSSSELRRARRAVDEAGLPCNKPRNSFRSSWVFCCFVCSAEVMEVPIERIMATAESLLTPASSFW
jgi:hypothetical protein